LSFDKKTEYSKEKYLKKKKNKYLAVYQIIKPTFRMMCEYYMQDMMKRKVLNLRIDILSQILTYANIAAYRNTLVIESCKGLIVAGVAERMGGKYFMHHRFFFNSLYLMLFEGFGKIINLSPNGAACSIK
jgi:tRNA (adenine-N(1)-)-methyltransferase non-catalytic subunit